MDCQNAINKSFLCGTSAESLSVGGVCRFSGRGFEDCDHLFYEIAAGASISQHAFWILEYVCVWVYVWAGGYTNKGSSTANEFSVDSDQATTHTPRQATAETAEVLVNHRGGGSVSLDQENVETAPPAYQAPKSEKKTHRVKKEDEYARLLQDNELEENIASSYREQESERLRTRRKRSGSHRQKEAPAIPERRYFHLSRS
ncbi:hypothetical protein TWF730_002711 [Orbilia blumenaviensis]|uniref:Uncharacterized protein n=1 Tax=Orbilia blumenaviensis TaxID=1796055 RepID=A0AAV9U7K9_9PEZI